MSADQNHGDADGREGEPAGDEVDVQHDDPSHQEKRAECRRENEHRQHKVCAVRPEGGSDPKEPVGASCCLPGAVACVTDRRRLAVWSPTPKLGSARRNGRDDGRVQLSRIRLANDGVPGVRSVEQYCRGLATGGAAGYGVGSAPAVPVPGPRLKLAAFLVPSFNGLFLAAGVGTRCFG